MLLPGGRNSCVQMLRLCNEYLFCTLEKWVAVLKERQYIDILSYVYVLIGT